MQAFRDLFRYRYLILAKAGADLRAEARRYYISYIWWVLEPIFDMVVYYVVFAVILNRGGADFVPFLLIGLTTWKWFNAGVVHSAHAIMQSKNLIQQVYLPKVALPSISILTDSFKFLIVFGLLVSFLWIYGFGPSTPYLALPVVMAVELLLTVSVAFFLGAITPLLPDLTIVIQNLLQLMFFLSGIFFDASKLPGTLGQLVYLNPMVTILESYRHILMRGIWPDFQALGIIAAGCCPLLLVGCALLTRFDTVYPRVVGQ